jgi:hypothetical protein
MSGGGVRYTSSSGGTCTLEAQKRVNTLAAADQDSFSTTWSSPLVLKQFLEVSATNIPQPFITTDAALAPVTVSRDIYVPTKMRAEVSADWALMYETIGDAVALTKSAPLTYEASPFLVRHEVITFDAAGDEVIEGTFFELLPFNGYQPSTAGNYTGATGTALLTSQGSKPLATLIATERTHRFTLVWTLEAADWNLTGPSLGGWQVLPFAQPFSPTLPSAVAVDAPPIFTLNVRMLPIS